MMQQVQGINTRRMKEGRDLLSLPNMKDAIPGRNAVAQLYSYLVALGLLGSVPVMPRYTTRLAGAALLVTFAILEWSLASAWRTYRRHLRLAQA